MLSESEINSIIALRDQTVRELKATESLPLLREAAAAKAMAAEYQKGAAAWSTGVFGATALSRDYLKAAGSAVWAVHSTVSAGSTR